MPLRGGRRVLPLASGAACAGVPPVMPDMPAGHVLSTWLDAVDRSDRGRAEGFIKAYATRLTPEGLKEGQRRSAVRSHRCTLQ